MKMSDMFNEHGLSWFPGDGVIFGLAWAACGFYLMHDDNITANIILAMVIGFISRGLIDALNHIISVVLIILCFIYGNRLEIRLFLLFWASFYVLGKLKDLKYRRAPTKLIRIINKAYLFIPIIYTIPCLIYALQSHKWSVFATFVSFDISYNCTRLLYERRQR